MGRESIDDKAEHRSSIELLVINKLELDDFRIAGVYLSDAVDIAEKSTDGKAASAGRGEADGKWLFLVGVTDGSLKEVSITPDHEQNRINKSDVGKKSEWRTIAYFSRLISSFDRLAADGL